MDNIVTGKVRFSFVNIFKPRANQDGGEPKYSLTLLIPKTDTQTLQAINNAMEQAIQNGISTTFGGNRPPRIKMPLYDGDGVRPNGEAFGPECAGCMVMTASSLQPPSVVDINLQPVLNQAEVYSGCYGRVSLRFFSYSKNGNKGVGCGLGNVQKLADGDPLSGRTTATDDFGGSNAYQQPAAIYQQNQYPQQAPPVVTYPQNNFQQAQSIDPVTGMPVMQGGVMGI